MRRGYFLLSFCLQVVRMGSFLLSALMRMPRENTITSAPTTVSTARFPKLIICSLVFTNSWAIVLYCLPSMMRMDTKLAMRSPFVSPNVLPTASTSNLLAAGILKKRSLYDDNDEDYLKVVVKSDKLICIT